MPRSPRTADDPVENLLAPLIRRRRTAAGWSLLGWDSEPGVQLTIARGQSIILIELEPFDSTRDCYARTRLFNVCARRYFQGRAALAPEERRAVEAVVELVRGREGALPPMERSSSARAGLVREIEVSRLLIAEGAGHYYINPYVGCTIGCEFCYVAPRADMSRVLKGLPSLPWGRYVDVKVNAAEVLRREIRRHPAGIVRLSPILTDPYQPLERRYRITRRCLEVLADAGGFKPVILTRASRVCEDIELLRRFPAAAVGFSIPTDDDRVRQKFEPGADPVEERISVLRRCHEAGLKTFAVVQPMLPMDPERLADLLAPHIDAVRVDRMHEMPRARRLYEAAAMTDAAQDAFFERTGRRLRRAFESRGVRYDELDDLAGIVEG